MTIKKTTDSHHGESQLKRILIRFNTLLIISILNIYAVFGQNITVNGVVRETNREPVPGVSIRVKNATIGTATDAEGKYSITVPSANTVLIFSFIGYEATEETVGNRRTIDVILSESATVIDEVVVTAMGVKRDQRALGYATSTIKASDLVIAGNTVNPLTTLYGKAAGVGIQAGAAGPTGGVNIKIRGAASLESSSKTRPLFVVDGVRIYDKESNMSQRDYDPLNSFDYGSGINDINPEDIESIEILKGAKASVLYGSEGANGVVLITTKRGAKTRGLGVTLSYQHTLEKPFSYIDWQNEYGTGSSTIWPTLPEGQTIRKISNDRYSFGPKFDGSPIQFFDGSINPYQAYPNNFNDLFRNGSSDQLNVAIAGGNEKGNMRVSYTNFNYNATLENHWQKRNSLSITGQMQVSDFASFEISTNTFYTQTHNRLGNLQDLIAWGVHRDYDYKKLKAIYLTEDGYMNKELYQDGGLPRSSLYLLDLWWNQNQNSNTDSRINNNTSVRATLRFTPWLYFVGQAGFNIQNTDMTRENPIRYTNPNQGGQYRFQRDNAVTQEYTGFLNFEKGFLNDDLNVHIFAGPSYNSLTDNTIYVSTYGGLNYPGWYSLANGQSFPGQANAGNVRGHSRGSDFSYGVLGQAVFSWKNIYYAEISARNDWSSTLPPANNSYFYPGVSFSWNFNEIFAIPHLNYGKLFTSFADVGRPASRYFALKSYDIGFLQLLPDVTSVSGPSDLFAGDLKPERKREFEIGLSSRWFKNRTEFNFSYYTNNIYNQIMSVPLTNSTGANNIRINAGNVSNWGYELYLKGTPVMTNDYKWDITWTMANQYSKVIKLYPGITRKPLGGGGFAVVADEGKRYGEILMYDYVRDDNGNRVVNNNGLYDLDRDAMKPVNKNISPDFFGGLMSSFFWKGFNAYVGLDYKFGGSIFSYSNYYLTALGETKNTLKYRDESHGGIAYYVADGQRIRCEHNLQQGPNGETVFHNGMILKGMKKNSDGSYSPNDIIANSTDYYRSFLSDMSDAFQPDALYRNDYIKLREVSIGYTLPKKWSEKVMMQKVNLALNARNLFYLYKTIPNIDVESTLGTSGENSYREQSFYPATRTYGFAINVSF